MLAPARAPLRAPFASEHNARTVGNTSRALARIAASLLFTTWLAAPARARAEPPRILRIDAPAAAGQDALRVEAKAKELVARACPGACAPGGDATVIPDVPAEVLASAGWTTPQVITLADGKHVVRWDATVSGAYNASSTWTVLLAAPLTSAKSTAPVVLWSGWVDRKKGLEGEEAINVVRVEPLAKGARVVIGEQRADLTICGRPAIVSAREIDPATVTLAKSSATMIDSIEAGDRKNAEKVIAVRETSSAAPPVVRLLRATSASSALEKKIGTLTDGDAQTGWTEGKVGDGHGEWVRMSAASEVGITGIAVQIRPGGPEVADGASPKTLYFATDSKLFEVQIPDSAWGDKDARYEVKLPAEVHTSCLAVVLGDAHMSKGVPNPRVTIAEITARTPLDAMSYDALATALAAGDEKSRAAAAMLGKGDGRAVASVAAAWDHFTEAGRRLAMEVVDAAACSDQAPFYADRLAVAKGKKMAGPTADPLVIHARDRLRRCGRASSPALSKLLHDAPDPIKIVAAEELALVSPPDAIGAILDVLPKVADPVRRDLRAALARAANSPKSKGELADWMVPAKLSTLGDVAKVDLLRAMGPALPDIEGGKKALFGLATKEAPFRTRYLLLAPAAELAAKGDVDAETFVRAALAKDADPHVRARAAEVAAKVAKLAPELVTAAADGEVRVREAAVHALTQSAGQGVTLPANTESTLVTRLGTDEWTFVRTGAAEALSAMPKSDVADKALAAALADKSAEVRGVVLDGLGAHQAKAYAGPVRARAEAADELVDVRARAILALGAMCDKGSLDLLTRLAQGARSLTSDVDRRLGAAALSALGDIHPDDLDTRITLLSAKDAPPLVREMAKAASAAKSRCNPPKKS